MWCIAAAVAGAALGAAAQVLLGWPWWLVAAGAVAALLTTLFESVAVAIVGLITFRDDLRARLRQARPAGVPVLAEATAMIASYLTVERELGRIAADADVETLALMLIGTGHLLFAGRRGTPPEAGAVHKVVSTVIAGVVQPDRRSAPQ